MSSLHFVVSVSVGAEETLNEKIREVADKINKYGTQTFPALNALKTAVKQVVVGPAFLGVLLEDGRAFRVAFSVIAERLDLSKHDSTSKGTGTASGSGGNSASNSNSKNSPASRQLTRSTRTRIMRTNNTSLRGGNNQSSSGSGSRSTGVIIGSAGSNRSLVTVPATFVPEELITQAQVVLQGKSRNLIIRELQRTNLDVNLAVNNLLSRDDEEGDETEEGSDNYVPEDLISLLDGGFHTDNSSVIIDADAMFPEDMFGYSNIRNLMLHSRSRERIQSTSGTQNEANATGGTSSSIRSSVNAGNVSGSSVTVSSNPAASNVGGAAGGGGTGSAGGDRENFGRWRDRQYFGARRWFTTTRDEVQWEKEQESKNKKDLSSGFPLWISDDLEFWPEREQCVRFTQIASLYSEMIGISTKGELHQWKWSDPEPYRHPEYPNIHHPKTQALNLIYERILHVSATTIRCSVATESGKIATWMDDLLGYAGNKLEHQATNYPEFTLDKIISLHTCTLYTVARTESGELFWWGVLPFSQRKKLWDKYKAKSKKPTRKEKDKDSSVNEVTVGAQVCMKNSPMYQPGAIGFCISNGVPKVGQLLNAAWDLMNNCRFKILSIGSSSSSSQNSVDIKDTLTKLVSVPSSSSSTGSGAGKSNQNAGKENSDRIDMPPPPSPASSTCSDTGSVSNKRPKRLAPKEDPDSKKDEEVWSLKDVVFVEDVRSVPVGRVLKVDGQFAAVRFPSTNPPKEKFDEASTDAWQDCRLMRKDDLQVIKSTATSRVPDCFQKIPRRVVLNIQLNEHSQLLTLAIDSKGIHAIMKTGVKLHYSLFNLNTGRLEKNSVFPTDLNSFMGKSPSNINLTTCAGGDNAESMLILRDGNRTIYPMAKDCMDAIRDPIWIDLPPLSCITATPLTLSGNNNVKTQVSLVVLATEQQILMPRIMRCDVDGIRYLLGQMDAEMKSQIPTILQEFTDGNRNIMHACVSMCSPTSNKDSEQDIIATSQSTSSNTGLECINAIANSIITNRSSNFRDIMRRSSSTSALAPSRSSEMDHGHHLPSNTGAADDNSLPLSYWPPEYEAATSGDEDSLSGLHMQHKLSSHSHSMPQINEIFISDPTERRMNALISITMLCESSVLQPYLRQLLSAKDAQGQTPFMMAVSCRAYQAGIVLFDTILKLANGDAQIRDSMIFPTGSSADQSPLHVLCCNDTCSFTWTGSDHINQDIYECTTCGLTGSLCCCTECAKVCHKGHDCKLKQTSPTAYCDCWEKCKCKALIAGNQTKRFELLEKLIKDTDLVTRFNSRGESILLFLIQTVGRQSVEQRQYRSTSRVRNSSSNQQRKTPSMDADSEMPDHDLEPPRFARKALERLLGDWNAIKAMIQTGAENEMDVCVSAPNQVFYEDNDNKSMYIHSQSGTIMLDKFTHILFFRCNNEPLETLLLTLVNELNNDGISGRVDEAQKVARRFVRSVSRVFVIFSIEKSSNSEKQRNSTTQTRLTLAFRRVFTSLLKYAVEELVEIADALIAPVRLGVVRPTAPFQLTSNSIDVISNADDLFSIEPLAPPVRQNPLVDESVRLESGDVSSGFLLRMNATLGNDIDENNDTDALGQDDGDTSEQDDINDNRAPASSQRQNNNNNNNNNVVDDVADDSMAQDADQEAESDNEFNFQEAETESDSDDNQSTQDAQRSVQTGATAGSDTDEDESGDSSQPDDDAESDEHSKEDFPLGDEQLERRPSSSHTPRNNLAPQSMQWAIRSRDSTRSTNLHRLTGGGSNLVFIDPNALRRSTTANAAVAAAAQEPPTMATTSSSLARAFGIVLRQISELVGMIAYNMSCPSSTTYQNYDLSYQEAVQLQMYVEKRLKPTWDWILTVMDATEAQLKFGASLTDSADPAHPLHPLNVPNSSSSSNDHQTQSRNNTNRRGSIQIQITTPSNILTSRARNRNEGADNTTSRRDFLTYCLSLMRAHNSEHRDSLPVLDVTALRHVAYVLDAIIFYMRSSNGSEVEKNDSNTWDDDNENENEDVDDELSNSIVMDTDSNDENDLMRPSLGKRHGFFMRSESTLCLGCPPPDAFNVPITEALPLADQPHLLQPNARREDIFGMPKQAITVPSSNITVGSSLELPPIRLGLSSHNKNDMSQNTGGNTNTVVIVTPAPVAAPAETIAEEVIQQVPKSVQQKRPLSPKPGTSKILSSNSGSHEIYYKKNRHFFTMNAKDYDDEDEDSADEEPQDLSQQGSSKMDIDDSSSNSRTVTLKVVKTASEMNMFDDSDDNDEIIRPPAHKKNRFDEESTKIIHSGPSGTTTVNLGPDTSITPELSSTIVIETIDHKQDSDQMSADSAVNRPPIIVTRRNVADAIESVTANLLAKNKKQMLSECGTSETPLTFLPNSFVYDISKQGEGSGYERSGELQTTQSGSPGKSVIVRVGPSTSITAQLEQQTIETMDTQDVSANVTVETTNSISQQQTAAVQQELPPRGVYFRSNVTSDLLLSRWRLSLILFGRVFLEDVGIEPGSIISELGGFPVKEAKFRRHMEKLRNAQQRDLTLSKMDRARPSLILQTFKELNTQYNNNNRRIQPPLAFNRVKVTFKDEPGEGSGVARSFYTLIAESLLSHENLPNLESAQVGSNKYSVPFSTMIRQRGGVASGTASGGSLSNIASNASNRGSDFNRRIPQKQSLWKPTRDSSKKLLLNYDSRPFRPLGDNVSGNDHLSGHQQQLGERLYQKVAQIHPTHAPKITGMLLDLPPTQLIMLLASDENLRQKSNEALDIINFRQRMEQENNSGSAGAAGGSNNNNNSASAILTTQSTILTTSSPSLTTGGGTTTLNIVNIESTSNAAGTTGQSSKKMNPIVVLEDCQLDDNAPLFYQPGKPNFYSPRQGYPSFERINAFRNVGRLIGLCLLQNELLPIFLQRHVLKYILGRQIRFHDLAFFDPVVYESLRQLVKDSQTKNGAQVLQSLELNFVVDLCQEEGGGSVELVHNGRDIIVNEQNVYDYVRKYAEYRMIKTQEKALEALRSGVFDVLPETALDTLTAEDLRLLLNGVGDINVSVLSNYTSFNDESNESAEKLQRFKRWLWQIVERMTNLERQDLIYFWTGSPALPASEEGFQPMPSVTIRPADDAHLPTANTCISRLYIPLYSSKAVLRHKLLLAIKTKNFGFV